MANILKSAIELLAGIPSVIYGFWGLIVLVPLLRKLEITVGIPPYGVSIFGASIILSIMIIPYASTMAVTMIIGNKNQLTFNVFVPGNTMASVIANEFTEASDTLYLSALIELGLLLFVVTAIINFSGRQIIKRYEIKGNDGVL